MLTALAVALAGEGRTRSRRRLVIEVERHGREPIAASLDLTRTVGWFTSLYPLPLELGGPDGLPGLDSASQTSQEPGSSDERQSLGDDAEWERAILHVKARSRSIPHGGIDYGIARYLPGSVDAQRLICGADAVFNYIGELRPGGAGRLIALAGEYTGPDVHPANASSEGVEALAWTAEGRLCLTIRLGAGGATAAERLVERWGAELRRLLTHCLRADAGRFTADDFETVQLSEDELEGLFHD
ncbi:putative non-ribosomal peptide synthetase [Paenibacillus sp. 598K]|nr:putative non-ribosomal peptide synthetase [Paenibacillus sp. 598K]